MTTAIAANSAAPHIAIGQVTGQILSVIWKRLPALALLSLLLVFVPFALSGLVPDNLSFLGRFAGLPGLIFDGAAALITYRQLTDDPISLGDAFGMGLQRFGSLWGMGIISGLAIALGTVLLIVPGVFLLVAWMPATTAIVAEDIGATPGLDRAWQLTRGRRWSVAAILGMVVGGLLLLALVFLVPTFLFAAQSDETLTNLLTFAILPAFFSVAQIVSVVAGAAVYAALREASEGLSADPASVFD